MNKKDERGGVDKIQKKKQKEREYNNEYYERNKDKHKERMKKYRDEHKEELNKYAKQYRKNNKDKEKQYREDNKDKLKKFRKQYYEEHKDKFSESTKRYYDEHRDELEKYGKQYREEHKDEAKQYREDNKDEFIKRRKQKRKSQGMSIMEENTKCSLWLGVHIAERILRNLFKNVQVMPHGNPGFDFICGKGKKIDAKSATKRESESWAFNVNKIADYFLCIAFTPRFYLENGDLDVSRLKVLFVWLLPCDMITKKKSGKRLNEQGSTKISVSTIHKWDEYLLEEKKINKAGDCCWCLKEGFNIDEL